MAKAPAKSKNEAEPAKPSMVGGLIGVVVATLLAAGAGGFVGLQVLSPKMKGDGQAAHAEAAPKSDPKGMSLDQLKVRQLSPIITNVAGGSKQWVRLEASVVLETEDLKDLNVLLAKISEDVTVYMKTVTLAQLEGNSALQYLKDDLNDRIKIRSEGKIKEIMVTGLVVE